MVTIIVLVLSLSVGILLRYALVEARINRANVLRLEAKNATEAALEYASAELAVRFQSNRSFNSASLAANPIATHTARFAPLFAAGASTPTSVVPDSVRLLVSTTSTGVSRRIDPRDPNNAFDPLRGQTVNSRYVRMLATATSRSAGIGEHIAYATQAIEIRDSQLFNYAIFYNLPMEFHPSPPMEVWGPVHSNENTYLTASETVHYYDTFTTAGQMLTSTLSTTGRPTGRSIHFTTGTDANGDGKPDTVPISGHNFRVGASTVTTHVDSSLAARVAGHNFADTASQLWRGNAQDVSLGVERQNPPGVLTPNDARKLIEPPDTAETANTSIEGQKFSRQAGLYAVVDRVSGNPRVTLFKSTADALEFKSSATRSAWITSNPTKVVTPPTGLIKPNRRMRDNREEKTINLVDIDLGKMRAALRATGSTPAEEKFRVNGADWDYQAGWNGAVYVEVENPGQGFTTTSDIDLASEASSSHGTGTGTGTATAVRLLNGKQLPSLAPTALYPNREHGFTFATNAPVYVAGHFNANGTFGTTSSPDGSERSPDPSYQNGTPTSLDDDTEVPALVAADAINVLSAAWVDASGKPVGDGLENNLTNNTNKGRVAANTEISAVFMGGIVQTPSGGNGYSGGVENYPRFHERWDGKTMRYRGSIVALFNSANGTGVWGKNNVYGAPTRKWGFHDFLKSGQYPPFTPTLRTYRRIDYRDITKPEFDTLLAESTNGFQLMVPPTPPTP
jgi:hypothetical protein